MSFTALLNAQPRRLGVGLGWSRWVSLGARVERPRNTP
jgi:hypothetical protein